MGVATGESGRTSQAEKKTRARRRETEGEVEGEAVADKGSSMKRRHHGGGT